MGLYGKYVLPRGVHLACSARPNMRQREKLVPLASGRVLEIGMGSGLNLPFYDARRVTKVWGLEPSPEMSKLASAAVEAVAFDVEFVSAGGEQIPLDSESFDTVLMTFTLCTIPDAERALREIARVLKRGGQLLFCEHGAAPDAGVRRWQNRINPLWRQLAGGCHLNRDIPGLIRRGGFEIARMDTMYIPGWRPASFNYWGTAGHPCGER
jgi:ubiquinone/menaquinone biosynthesis C-methylase UbiE